MLFLLTWFMLLPRCTTQSPGQALDVLLQDYAYRAFIRPKTGIPYDGDVPSNLTGVKISALRLRSGSLRRKGVQMYGEFHIPKGVIQTPYVKRLVLVYQNLGNWSSVYYPLHGYSLLAPVLGLLAYNGTNLSATNLPVLDIMASGVDPISIMFSDVNSVADEKSVAKCVSFDLNGSVSFDNVIGGNMCETIQQGHFSIVVESNAPSPAPAPNVGPGPSGEKENESKIWIIVGSVIGGVVLLLLFGLLVFWWACRYRRREKMEHMERAAEAGEGLRMTSVGNNAKVPTAMMTRTQPTLENEYVP